MEVLKDDQPIPLGGTKQRATLGYLLLNANRVVPTRELLGALWADGSLPTTARKILQNAVWGLRGALSPCHADRQAGVLVTKTPGYVIQVDPDRVDLHLFHRRIREGRALLESGSSAQAADILRDALSLWQGQALADLVESGIDWPELAAAESARLDAMEDYFEAGLHCGRHQSMLGALESMVEAEPLRERLCGQLMLALYRCGRQADALNVYSRVRASLIGDLGLEPRRELQSLQQAILNQDSGLSLPEATAPVTVQTETGPSGDHAWLRSPQPWAAAAPPLASAQEAMEHSEYASSGTGDLGAHPRVPRQRTASAGRRRPVSVLLLKARLRSPTDSGRSEGTDELRDSVTGRIREVVGGFGGSVIGSIGSTQLAVFGPWDGDDYAERAVRAALGIRDEFHTPDAVVPLTRSARRSREATVHAAVSTGEALLRYDDHGSDVRSADGTLLDECQSLLSHTGAGDVWVCGSTRQLAASALSYVHVSDSPQAWKADRPRTRDERSRLPGVVDREIELDVLRGMLERVRHRGTPHVVTILGEAGTGKSRLLKEFERRAMGQPVAMRFLVPCSLDRQGEACGGTHLFHSRMSPLFDPHGTETREIDLTRLVKSTQSPLADIAQGCPLVMVVDDLHEADDALLDFICAVSSEAAEGTLFIAAAARPELFARRPGWGGGTPHFMTISIDASGSGHQPLTNSRAQPAEPPVPGFVDCMP